MKKILSFFVLLLISASTYASHISGGEITYISLGNNQYEVHYTVYWDCSGGFNPGTSQTIDVTGCLGTQTVTLDQSPLTPGDGIDVSQICSAATSTCNGGTVDGKNMIDYVGIVTLPGACTDWVFSYNTCCRGGNINNLTGGSTADSYVFATLNNLNAPNNNSPIFTAQPLPYLCVNQPACYNFGVVEQDGNNLVYSLIAAQGTNGGDSLPYVAPNSGGTPIPGITINPANGQITFTPTVQGDFVVVVLVEEFDANGVLVGSIIRDVQMVIQNCSNLTIGCGAGGLNSGNVTGNGAVLNPANPHEIQICEGIPFSFNVNFTDPNAGDSLKISTNLLTNPALVGATANVTYPVPGQPNNVALNFNWTAPPGSANQNTFLTVTVFDNACPIPGQQVINYYLNILPAANAGPDTTICLGDGAVLHGTGPGGPYNWFDLGGIMMATGPQMTCNPCQTPTVSPNLGTTTYVLQTSGASGCVNKDTVEITVVPTFNWALTPGPTASGCTGNPIQLGVTPNPVGVYTYAWTPTTGLNMPMVSTPLLTMTDAETVTYSVTMTSDLGCIKRDSIVVTAQQGPPPFTTRNDTCMNSLPAAPLQLDVEFPCLSGASCALSPGTACTGSSNVIQVGTNTVPNFTNPSPFMGVWEDGRAQYLFRATELQALGLGQGIINSIALNVSSVGGQTYAGLTVKIKCTATNSLAIGAFEAGATTVYTSPLYAPTVGLNTFNFTSPYAYDGVSNLLIEFCYDNNDWSGGDEVLSTATTFPSSVTFDQDGLVGCTVASSETVYSERPNVTFNFSSSVNPANYTYNWSPAIGLSNPNIKNPTVMPPTGTTTYTVTVTTLNGLCSRTESVTISVGGSNATIVTTDSVFCNSDPVQQFSLSPTTPTGGTWSHHVNGTGNGGGVLPGAGNTADFHPELSVLGNSHVVYSVGPANCMIQDSVLVLVSQKIPADFTTFGPYCEYNTPVALSAFANNAGGIWTINNVVATQFDPATLGPSIPPGHSVKYKTDLGVGCPDSLTKFVEVFDAPEVDFSADTLAGCLPSVPVAFTSTVTTTSAPASYSWSFGNASTTSLPNPVHVYTQAGLFTVSLTYTDINNCVDTETKTGYITINSVPEPEFIYEPSNPTSLEPHVDFLNQTPNGANLAYQWDISGLDSSDLFNVSYDFPGEGTYTITLTATTVNGCFASVTRPLIIDPDFAIYVPNTFTPNDDGLNDLFLPKSFGVSPDDYTLAIYDRWGERIFLTHNLTEGWNGSLSNNGNISKEHNVFIYKIIYKDAFLKQRSLTGHVNLVR